ncbi:MAG: LssY C-terminal domain-containing protein [Deltaproteobacteria bacterium]|nr:LssY C-terminal domain-containing protein [Deltaproteobacteria bacterium]
MNQETPVVEPLDAVCSDSLYCFSPENRRGLNVPEFPGYLSCLDEDWIFQTRVDPDYYSPAEVAYIKRFRFSRSKNNRMRAHFESMDVPVLVPPKETVSGFVHTDADPGFKYVNVVLVGFESVEIFNIVVEVPGIKADYEEVDLDSLYSREEIVDCDEEELRAALEKMPCCTTNKRGTGKGDPLNLVFIGDVEDLLVALVGSGWDVTERMSSGSMWRTVKSFFLGKRYRHSPVSSLYVFGRRQDAAFQKARQSVNERNHLRLWLSPLRFKNKPVWIGQISRDIGVKFTLRVGFLTTHVIDPDVDNDRWYLIQNLVEAHALAKLGYVAGVGKAPPDNPKHNLGGDPYFTDGLRAVMVCTKFPVRFKDVELFDWEFPPQSEKYRDYLVRQVKPGRKESRPDRAAGFSHRRGTR